MGESWNINGGIGVVALQLTKIALLVLKIMIPQLKNLKITSKQNIKVLIYNYTLSTPKSPKPCIYVTSNPSQKIFFVTISYRALMIQHFLLQRYNYFYYTCGDSKVSHAMLT